MRVQNKIKAHKIKLFEERKNIEPQFIPETVSQLVKSCIDENAARLIKQIAFQGGELKLTDFRRYDGNLAFNFIINDKVFSGKFTDKLHQHTDIDIVEINSYIFFSGFDRHIFPPKKFSASII